MAELEKLRAEIRGEVTKASASVADRTVSNWRSTRLRFSNKLKAFVAASRARLRAERDHAPHLSRRQAHLLRHAEPITTKRSRKSRKAAPTSNRPSACLSNSNLNSTHEISQSTIIVRWRFFAASLLAAARKKKPKRKRSDREKHEENIVTLTKENLRTRRDQNRSRSRSEASKRR